MFKFLNVNKATGVGTGKGTRRCCLPLIECILNKQASTFYTIFGYSVYLKITIFCVSNYNLNWSIFEIEIKFKGSNVASSGANVIKLFVYNLRIFVIS